MIEIMKDGDMWSLVICGKFHGRYDSYIAAVKKEEEIKGGTEMNEDMCCGNCKHGCIRCTGTEWLECICDLNKNPLGAYSLCCDWEGEEDEVQSKP